MPLHIEKVSHRYGAIEVLDGIELDIADGETVVLIGPSGCGKSTLLGILGGLLQPTSGRVTLSGAPPAQSLNPFTYIFQDFALLPWRSVADNVALALEHRDLGAAERKERVASALALTGLANSRPPIPSSSPAACASGSASPARWSCGRPCCCSTSHCRRSTPRRASS